MSNNSMFELRPLDTLFVGNGKPFAMGEEVWAEELFPPPLSVFAGAMRSEFFSRNMDKFDQYAKAYAQKAGGKKEFMDITELDPSSNIRLRDLCYTDGQDYFLPTPADLIAPEQKDADQKSVSEGTFQARSFPVEPLSLIPSTAVSSHKLPYLLKPRSAAKVKGAGLSLLRLADYRKSGKKITNIHKRLSLLRLADYRKYLQGDSSSLEAIPLEQFLSREPKIGIARDRTTRGAKDGQLYRVPMLRLLHGLRFAFRLEWNEAMAGKGLVKFGAEGKSAVCQVIHEPKWELPFAAEKFTSEFFKVVLLTPAYFRHGWLPGFLSAAKENGRNCFAGTWEGKRVELIAATLGKYQPIGGYDMMQRLSKDMQRLVPAGAVYYFKTANQADALAIAQAVHGQCVADTPPMQQLGFGQVFAAPVQPPQGE